MEFLEIVITTGVLIFAMMVIQNKNPKKQNTKQQTDLEDNTKSISSNNTGNPVPNIRTKNRDKLYDEGGSCFTETKSTSKINASKSHKNRPKSAQNRADESEFALRKAIVYSEILRPKFKDDEI